MINISLPEISELTKYDLKELPDEEGVYFIFNRNDELIYIGKSIHIRSRATSHLTKNSPIRDKNEIFAGSYVLHNDYKVSTEGVERIYISHYKPKYNDIKPLAPNEVITPELQAWAMKNVPMR